MLRTASPEEHRKSARFRENEAARGRTSSPLLQRRASRRRLPRHRLPAAPASLEGGPNRAQVWQLRTPGHGRCGCSFGARMEQADGARRQPRLARRAQANRSRVARCCATPLVWVESSRSTACRPAERVPGERARFIRVRADVRARKEYPHRFRASRPPGMPPPLQGIAAHRAASRRFAAGIGAGGLLRARYLRARPVLILNGTFCSRRPCQTSNSIVTAGPAPLMR
jgi:hypothetical protein